MKRTLATVLAGLSLSVLAVAGIAAQTGQRATAAAPAAAAACDRACLLGIADAYLAALVKHDPSKAAMAPGAKFTEQAQPLAVGEGVMWKAATGISPTFKLPVPDPTAGQVGIIVMMKASGNAPGGAPVPDRDIELAVRLKVVNRQITEAEHLMATITGASLTNLQTLRPGLLADVPAAERTPRQYMLLIGNSYYDAIVQSNGDVSPFADDCGRRENGMHTAGVGTQGCREQLNSRSMSYITSIDLRRVWITDDQKGLVFGMTMFRQPMEQKFVTVVNPDGTTREQPMNFNPFDLEAAHIFKIRGGKIHEIEAMGYSLPLNSKNGWNPFTR